MPRETAVLMWTALSLGFFHTLIGPDHYLPFVVMSKARGWSMFKTNIIVFLCGVAHVASSIVLGFIGIAVGITLFKLEALESFRGEIAGWFLLIFGFTYFVWGIHMAIQNRQHQHIHNHYCGGAHEHIHSHTGGHLHLHEDKKKADITPWIIFTIFVFGPCEPLIPILMYPAAKGSLVSVIMVATIFGAATILTMLVIVALMFYGLMKLPTSKLEKYSHALAGLAILLCGIAIKFFGL
ncbi:MAG: sulfite exporter TauE/SafE family protein [Candidatus Omnitrophota bacterium]